MAPVAKSNVLTRKLGPAPVWAWAAAGLVVAWFLFLRPSTAHSASQTTQAPVTGSTAGVPSTGAAGSTDANGNAGDLLAQLLQGQQSVIDKLAGAFVGGGQGVTGGSSAAATASPSSGVAPSSVALAGPAASPSPYIYSTPPPYSPDTPTYIIPGVDGAPPTYFQPPGYFQNEQGLGILPGFGGQSPDVRQAVYDAASVPVSTFAAASASQPTPIATVTPSPVDTGSFRVPGTRTVAV